jgi:EAL domain-containing protein (putative c-di-GMP-specific phosphodiesterase class I)/GGDEF domain-containing protein
MHPMNSNFACSALDAEFRLRTHQALLASQHSLRQVALILISLDGGGNRSDPSSETHSAAYNSILMRLRSDLRESDTVMKLTNNRIGVLLPSITGREDIDQVIKRLTGVLKESYEIDSLEPRVGIAVFPEHSNDASSLFQRAEEALTEATATSSFYALYSMASNGLSNSRHWMSELRQAIVSDQLFLLYQPKVSLSSGNVVGVEVLTRWRHPKLGTIVPDKFIPVAERTGLIIPLTLWVLQQALDLCRQWREMGLDLSVAVNLTMWNLETQELPEQITGLLRDAGVPAKNLELEITESAIMSDPERVIRTLKQIRELGVQFAIDDFGTGYSSFAYLKKLPVECIKIDKSFILNVEADRDNALIVRSIIDLGHNLRLKVVAEGVETRASKDLLISFQCDEGQGYFFNPPVTADTITRILLEGPHANNGQPPIHGTRRMPRPRLATEQAMPPTNYKSKYQNG